MLASFLCTSNHGYSTLLVTRDAKHAHVTTVEVEARRDGKFPAKPRRREIPEELRGWMPEHVHDTCNMDSTVRVQCSTTRA